MARFFAALLCLALAQGAAAFSRPGEVRLEQLPPEARQTLDRIRRGGPFPHTQDGATFGNREGLLPPKPRGHYREFTVRTPGSRDRGARRIVAGHGTSAVHGGTSAVQGGPSAVHGQGEFYYTDDHYRSFRRILE